MEAAFFTRSAEEIVDSISLSRPACEEIQCCIRDGRKTRAINLLVRHAHITKAEAKAAVEHMEAEFKGRPVDLVEIAADDVRAYTLDELLDGPHGKGGPVRYLFRVGADLFQSSAVRYRDSKEACFQADKECHPVSRADQIWQISPRNA